MLACESEPEPASPSEATAKVVAEKAETVAKAASAQPPANTTPPANATPPTSIPPRAAVFFRKAPKYRLTVWALPEVTAPDPTAARDLGIVADDNGDSVALSHDGQWLAFLDDGRLVLARLDGSARHQITKHRASSVQIWITGFAPDSSVLLFYQGVTQTDDPAPLPKDVVEGFQRLTLADLTLEPVTSLKEVEAFTDDGRHVIFQRRLPDHSATLMRFDLYTGAEEALQQIVGAQYGFSQLVMHGDRIAYVDHAMGGKSRVVADVLAGGKRIEISPEGSFAQYQRPQISPDGLRVAYTDEKTLLVRTFENDATQTLATCTESYCAHGWDSATTMLLHDEDQLSRVSLDGTKVALATDVKELMLAGARR
jgi:hypothetical protein